MKAFSSPILENNKHVSAKYYQNTLYALTYHLEKALPQGGIVCALFPKGILQHILPKAAKEKNCTVIIIQSTKEATLAFMQAGVLDQKTDPGKADIYITEPAGFSQNGALVSPQETATIKKYNAIGIGSALQFQEKIPAEYDWLPMSKIITELGIHSIENFEEEFKRSSSTTTSTPSPTFQPQPAKP